VSWVEEEGKWEKGESWGNESSILMLWRPFPLDKDVHVDAFRDLKIMVELDLSNNNITNLVAKTFEGNDRLQTLKLANNRVSLSDDCTG